MLDVCLLANLIITLYYICVMLLSVIMNTLGFSLCFQLSKLSVAQVSPFEYTHIKYT